MPMHDWLDLVTNKPVASVLRSFDDYALPPTEEEALAAGFTSEEYAAAKWEKQLGGGVRVIRSPFWGSKGNWAISLVLLGSYAILNSGVI